METEHAKKPLATRLKKKQRGFYTDPSPGFYAVTETFDKAHRRAKTAGIIAALMKLALLNEADPASTLGNLLRGRPEGLRAAVRSRDGGNMVFWTQPGPALGSGGTFERTGVPQNATPEYGGV